MLTLLYYKIFGSIPYLIFLLFVVSYKLFDSDHPHLPRQKNKRIDLHNPLIHY